jgi:hypothetical protein
MLELNWTNCDYLGSTRYYNELKWVEFRSWGDQHDIFDWVQHRPILEESILQN